MKIFHKDSRDNRGGRDNRFDRDRTRQMHKAVCSQCGADCEVPFRPTGDRPIFCSDCFGKQKGETRFEKPRGDYRERSRYDDKRMFTAVCNKCGNKCEVPFRPTGEKPVYCQQCFGMNKNSGSPVIQTISQKENEISTQFDKLNSKLDKILKLLIPTLVVEEPQPDKKEGEKKEKSKVKVAKKAKKK